MLICLLIIFSETSHKSEASLDKRSNDILLPDYRTPRSLARINLRYRAPSTFHQRRSANARTIYTKRRRSCTGYQRRRPRLQGAGYGWKGDVNEVQSLLKGGSLPHGYWHILDLGFNYPSWR
jgi:hypothetical protein